MSSRVPLTAAPQPREPSAASPGAIVLFAAVSMFLSGGFGLLWGLAAVLNSVVIRAGGNGDVPIADFTAWGWVWIVLGILLMLTGIGLGLGVGVARWMAIFFVSVSALATFGMMPAFPIIALIIIALDVLVLYQLLANWWE
jgi:hypothetical protein